MPDKPNLNSSRGKVEQACDNCMHCREDIFVPGTYTCYNAKQIFTIVKPDDYCFYYEPEKSQR